MLDDKFLLGAQVTFVMSINKKTQIGNYNKLIREKNLIIDFTKQKAPSYEMIMVLDGQIDITYGEPTLPAEKNDLILLPKKSAEEKKYFFFVQLTEKNLGGELINMFFDAKDGLTADIVKFSTDLNNNIRSDFIKLRKSWDLKQVGYRCACNACLYSIVSQLQTMNQKGYLPSGKFEMIKPGVNYIYENCFSSDFDYLTISKLSGVSYTYFKKLFKQKYNMTPSDFVLNARMNKAREMLLSEFYSVADIAAAVGYDNVYYFSKVFKDNNGCPPTKYHK